MFKGRRETSTTIPAHAHTKIAAEVAMGQFTYGSFCSGIESASVAWSELPWRLKFVSEINEHCLKVLDNHYPYVYNLGNMRYLDETKVPQTYLFIAGTPCQPFSIIGKRAGLDDPRGNLTEIYFRLVRTCLPRWVIWENVPGILSIDKGRTFGAILGSLAKCGYGFAYRVLDAQHFGVPQVRRRLFLVAYLGDWKRPASVLFEPKDVQKDSEEINSAVPSIRIRRSLRSKNTGRTVVGTILRSYGRSSGETQAEVRNGLILDGKNALGLPKIRYLTIVECERLQGLPDNYTCTGGDDICERYSAVGNCFNVLVVKWLGIRIQAIEEQLNGGQL